MLLCCLFKVHIFSRPPQKDGEPAVIAGEVSGLSRKTNGVRFFLHPVMVCVSEEILADKFLCPGSRVRVSGRLSSFSYPGNPGQFDEFSYYKSKNITYILYAEKLEVLSEAAAGQRILASFRERLREVYFQILPEEEAKTLIAMILGEKGELSEELREAYQQAGIGHLLAISGLHISIVAMALYQGILLLKGSRRTAAASGIIALFLYGELTGFSVSASRAVIMLFLALLAGLLGRSYDRETALAFSSIWILMGQPGQLFQGSFLLSFGAALGAGVVSGLLEKAFLMDLPEKRGLGVKRIILFQLSVSLMTLPVILWFYYEIPVYGMLLNIFLVPLMGLITGGGLLAGLSGLFWLPAGRFFAGGVWFLLRLYERAAKLSLELPFAIWNPGRPDFWKLVVYGIGVFAVLCCLKYQAEKKRHLAAFELFLLALLLLLPEKREGLEITVLDVGQGDGIYMDCEEGLACLIDGGSSSEKKIGKYRLEPFLKYRGTGRLDYIFVSHTDEDHINGIRELLEAGRVSCLVLPANLQKEKEAEELVLQGKEKGVKIWWIRPGEGIKKGKFSLTCLAPEENFVGSGKNEGSMVLLLEYDGFCGIFLGDLEKTGEEVLLEKERRKTFLPDCDFLKVAHHGSDGATGEEFLDLVKPELAVISCSRKNVYGHPGKKLLKRLSEAGCRTFITSEGGAVTVKYRAGKIRVSQFQKKYGNSGNRY